MKKYQYQCQVNVEVTFLPEHSDIQKNAYCFAYHVTITNTGEIPVQLISRYWIISDADGEEKEVKGLGVVGEQPLIMPNQQYQYTSSTLITMPVGSMRGTYQMLAEDGTQFDAVIHPFVLSMPRVLH
jgi:ApaG protein